MELSDSIGCWLLLLFLWFCEMLAWTIVVVLEIVKLGFVGQGVEMIETESD